MARELTREEKRAIRALVTKWCANYDREYEKLWWPLSDLLEKLSAIVRL